MKISSLVIVFRSFYKYKLTGDSDILQGIYPEICKSTFLKRFEYNFFPANSILT